MATQSTGHIYTVIQRAITQFCQRISHRGDNGAEWHKRFDCTMDDMSSLLDCMIFPVDETDATVTAAGAP
jgi:hypothetical protein